MKMLKLVKLIIGTLSFGAVTGIALEVVTNPGFCVSIFDYLTGYTSKVLLFALILSGLAMCFNKPMKNKEKEE